MEQGARHRLHIAQATDWKDAVIALLEPRSPYRPWRYGTHEAQEGDTVAFVLNTDPTSVLASVAHVETNGNPRAAVFERELLQPNLVELVTLAKVLDLELWAGSRWDFDGDDAIKVELALDDCRYWSAPESRFGHNSMAAARTLLRFDGWCDSCEQRVDITGPDARDRLFPHSVDPYIRPGAGTADLGDLDWPAVLCRDCRDHMRDGGYARFVDFKFAIHPLCPECGARRTCATFYGMPSDHTNIPPWSHAGGCCPTPEKWYCGDCSHTW
ncbi:hypothetical protein CIW52_04215 [Mycolicibacterium sp. P9-64]|uniref:hypothetical protein n=1 Tax=Mycolicibacterium sp. P9-64 TaxID=2024612 RepID=UPI0011EF73FD|nr:hypothetical protein [Mycolicibacterium sp. P9-64]KAA0087068.1 hypothetical protein CIW52_04215 [Mycolicibacterium sp. P9-64]